MKMMTNYVAACAALTGCFAVGREVRAGAAEVETIDLGAIGINADFEDPDLMGFSSKEQFVRGDVGPGWKALVPDTNENDYGVQDPRVAYDNSPGPLPALLVAVAGGLIVAAVAHRRRRHTRIVPAVATTCRPRVAEKISYLT